MRITTAILVLLFAPGVLLGQSELDIRITGGIAMPSGDFGDDDFESNNSGGATTGFWAGADLLIPTGTEGLEWVSSASIGTLGVDNTFAHQMAEWAVGGFSVSNVSPGRYLVVPVLTGLQYAVPVGEMVLTPMGQAGLAFTNGPNGTFSVDDGFEQVEVDSSIGTGTSFGFAVGAGLTVRPKLTVSLKYLSLGEAERDAELTGGDGSMTAELTQPIQVIQIGVAYLVN